MAEIRPIAQPVPQIDDERVIVTEWRFAPRAETGWHRHSYDYVVVPLSDGQLEIEQPDGTTTIAQLRAGASYARKAGVEHNVINASGHDFAFVEIELKGTPAG